MTQPVTPSPPSPKRAKRWVCKVLLGIVLLVTVLSLGAAASLWYVYEHHLKPQENNEWTYTLHIKSFAFPISIPRAMFWASSPRVGPWLTWVKKDTSKGQYRLGWDAEQQALLVICENCQSRWKDLSQTPVLIERVQLSIHQNQDQQISGVITMGSSTLEMEQVKLSWIGELTPQALSMHIFGQEVSLHSIFHLFKENIPELKYAHITGSMDLHVATNLPEFKISISDLQIHDFTVSGLGTQNIISSSSACGPPSKLPMQSWLVQAVISAEDQRFENHPGYDLQELLSAYNANQLGGGIIRGGSTITQQTAKMLYTGPEKTLIRKLRELLYAVEMERTLGKARIMQLYLDNAPWGIYPNGRILCGAQTAAQHYFKVDANKLKPQQAVWMAAMLHSPVREARQWQETGRINLERAIWITKYVRHIPGVGPRTRARVIATLKHDPSLGMKPPPKPARTPRKP